MHECKYQTKIAEMYTDIKWMRKDAERRNGIMEEHVKESDKFRKQVTHNTVWRHVYKIAFGVVAYLFVKVFFK